MENKMTDAEKLRTLADWFDVQDHKVAKVGDEVQADLRRIADSLEPLAKENEELKFFQRIQKENHDKMLTDLAKFEEENTRLKKESELSRELIFALHEYGKSIKGRYLKWDKNAFDKVVKLGEEYSIIQSEKQKP